MSTICVCSAHRQQGKTQLVMRLVKGLTEEGFEVGTIKHIGSESKFEGSKVKDTFRHAEAGAKLVVAVTEQEIISINKDEECTLENAIKKFPKNIDFIIVEGFSKSSYPRFVIIDKATELEMKGLTQNGPVLGISGIITNDKEELAKLENKYPIIEEKKVENFISIIKKERLRDISSKLPLKNCGECGFQTCDEMAEQLMHKKVSFDRCSHLSAELTLQVDGEYIFVKDFVQNIIRKSVEGMIQTLKNVPRNPKKIEITIKSDMA
ncbi:MAG TPA: molybdopterin-guanine dinucleotide biosynthesis protein B [Candidatus Deferrimicrobium sp.]|nr:molybdopterin-guanine dinucleotide biosynthesis protein B [Candidatus Deferrimicrobium sp.]